MENKKNSSAGPDLSNNVNSLAFLQDLYGVDEETATSILRDIDLLCEGLLELANQK